MLRAAFASRRAGYRREFAAALVIPFALYPVKTLFRVTFVAVAVPAGVTRHLCFPPLCVSFFSLCSPDELLRMRCCFVFCFFCCRRVSCCRSVHPQSAEGARSHEPRHVPREVSKVRGDRVHRHLPQERQAAQGETSREEDDSSVVRTMTSL